LTVKLKIIFRISPFIRVYPEKYHL